MNRVDELLNKYLDNELLPEELNEVQNLLLDEDNIKILKALQTVEFSVRKLDYDKAPIGITEKVMNKINALPSKYKTKGNYFALTISSIFIISIVVILIFLFGMISWTSADSGLTTKVDDSIKIVKDNIPTFLKIFENKSVMFFGSFFSLVLLLSAYFTFESHKSFKKKLESFTNS